MIAYLYRWRIEPTKEAEFERAWTFVTEYFRAHAGSLGSRLHRGDDGLWYGYAQWPSAETRARAAVRDDEFSASLRIMKDATLEAWPEIALTPVRDFLIAPDNIN